MILNSSKHNYIIDLLRLIAAFMVVLFHLNQPIPSLNNWYRNLVRYGWLGVPVFFVISGFCVMLAAEHAKTAGEFLKRRFFRIYLPYWVSLIIVLLAAVIQKTFTGYNSVLNIPSTPVAVLANISLSTSPFSSVPTINWVYWSLNCEVLFYLLIGIALIKSNMTVYLILLVSLLAVLLPKQQTGQIFFFDHWPAFGCGLSIFYFSKYLIKNKLLIALPLFVINLIGLFHKQPVEYIAAALLTVTIIFASNYIQSPKNWFTVMGEHSYAVYLIHVPIGIFILGAFKVPYIQQHLFANMVYDIFAYALISILAWQFFILIEKPSIRLGKEPLTFFHHLKKLYKH